MSEIIDAFTNIADGRFCTKLPPELRGKTIDEMRDGEVGYTTPWAMVVDVTGSLYILREYPVYDITGGTVSMKIERHSNYVVVDRDSIKKERFYPTKSKINWSETDKHIPVRLGKIEEG